MFSCAVFDVKRIVTNFLSPHPVTSDDIYFGSGCSGARPVTGERACRSTGDLIFTDWTGRAVGIVCLSVCQFASCTLVFQTDLTFELEYSVCVWVTNLAHHAIGRQGHIL